MGARLVANGCCQAGQSRSNEVIGIYAEHSIFSRPQEARDESVRRQISTGTCGTFSNAGLVQLGEVAARRHPLIATCERMAAHAVGEYRRPGIIIYSAWGITKAAECVTGCASLGTIVFTFSPGSEVAQIGFECLPFNNGERMYQAKKVLILVIFEFCMVIL